MISIVTAYYNRKELFYETLKSITRSKIKDIELIAVDDGSSPEHRIENFCTKFPFLKIIRTEREENRARVSSCVRFNIGLREAKGDYIVLQNPECLHVHDVLSHVIDVVNDSNYISMSAYGIDENLTKQLPEFNNDNAIIEFFNKLPQQKYNGGPSLGWYNHSKFRPTYYHFCSAMTRINMKYLNGFDERYAYGIGYEDDEFIFRIKKLGLKMIIADNISVIHQYHMPTYFQLSEKNNLIYSSRTKIENAYRANTTKLWNGI